MNFFVSGFFDFSSKIISINRSFAFTTPIYAEERKRDKPTVVFVLGGPGAGKGTQCANIVEKYHFVHLSAGDLLREEIKSGSPHGEMISNLIKNGQIVPSEITVGLLDAAMQKSGQSKFLIDGFPRNEENNGSWQRAMGDKVKFAFVLFLDCPESVMEKRLLIRGESSGRTDDNIDSIRKRFKTYVDQTRPVINYYASINKLVHINADQSTDKVWNDIKRAFDKHQF